MQRPIYTGVILFSILLAIVSCQHNPAWPILQQAEELMEAHPETALRLLEDSIQPASLSGKAQADWCLLITQARDKNYVDHTSDSLIRIACEYYENHPDPERSTLAYFYRGLVARELGSTLLAQDYFLKAMESGESSHNIPLKALIYNQVGELYTAQAVYHQAIPFLQRAFDLYKQTNDTEGMSFALRDIGRAYHQLDSINAALEAYQEALKYEHPNSRGSILSGLGGMYAKKEEYEQALSCLREALQSAETTRETDPLFLTLGRVFREMGKNDSARFYLNKCVDSQRMNTRAGSYYHLYHLSRDEQDWPTYALMQRKYEELNDSILKSEKTNQIRKSNEIYHYQQAEKYKLKHLTSQRNVYQMALLVLLLLGSLGSLYFSFRKWKKQKESLLERQEKQLHINENRIAALEAQLADSTHTQEQMDSLKSEIRKLETTNEQIRLKKEEQKNLLITNFENSPLYGKFITVINSNESWTIKEKQVLKKWVDKEHPAFIRKINTLCPTLKSEFRPLAYLIRVGFDTKEIHNIYNVSEQAVSAWKRELHRELTGTADSARGLDELIRSF